MNKFTMTADCEPKNSDKWFDGFQEGSEFQAESLEQAQDWLNDQCRLAGTDEDSHYNDHGPLATEQDNE